MMDEQCRLDLMESHHVTGKYCSRKDVEYISSRSKALPLPVGIPDRQSFVERKLQLFSSTQAAVILQLAYVHVEMKYFPQVLADVALFKLYLRLTALLWLGLVLFFLFFLFFLLFKEVFGKT